MKKLVLVPLLLWALSVWLVVALLFLGHWSWWLLLVLLPPVPFLIKAYLLGRSDPNQPEKR